MFHSLPLLVLLPIFVVAAVAVWIAGVQLSNTSDDLSDRFHLGQALGGLVFLAITTNLPEIAITSTAAVSHNLGIAIGNILGGIAVQTLVLVGLDALALRGKFALTWRAASLTLLLECVVVVAVLIVSIMGKQLPGSAIFFHITPSSLLIALLWLLGLWLLRKARNDLPWQDKGRAPNRDASANGNGQDSAKQGSSQQNKKQTSLARTLIIFIIAAIVTLAAGAALEESGSVIADKIGLSGVLFGATVLAVATALPEISTGYQSVKLGAYEMAMSDIFGGNAFLPVLFLLADILSGQAALTQAQNTDIYLAGLGILLTTAYMVGIIFRPQRQILDMGLDSFAVLILYLLGIAGLFTIVLVGGK
ncbi:MAG TPA: sodium:calcium antiporter [Ktedonobacteraceae bacterium]|nr:sodium:calcium antiporter [Ktedonobacteraceae bacterium]